MAIILEGPDAAGKTTLGRMLRDRHYMDLCVAGGAPKSREEVVKYCEEQLANCQRPGAVIDRITPISHPIYNPVYQGDPMILAYLAQMIHRPDTVVVYCRPPNDILMMPEKHEWKDYDTEEHKQKILDGQHRFIEKYDECFRRIPCLHYDYTQEDVIEFAARLHIASMSLQNMQILKRLTLMWSPVNV